MFEGAGNLVLAWQMSIKPSKWRLTNRGATKIVVVPGHFGGVGYIHTKKLRPASSDNHFRGLRRTCSFVLFLAKNSNYEVLSIFCLFLCVLLIKDHICFEPMAMAFQ